MILVTGRRVSTLSSVSELGRLPGVLGAIGDQVSSSALGLRVDLSQIPEPGSQ